MIKQTPHIDARQLPQNNLMTLEAPTVYSVCKAFYNLSTTEFKIIELLADHGCFVGNAQDLSKRLGICYTQITSALTSLDNYGVILRNTTGDKKVRMIAVTLRDLCHHSATVINTYLKEIIYALVNFSWISLGWDYSILYIQIP